MNPTKQHLPFILLTAAIFICFAGPYIIGEGMFTDGLLYSVVSNNMAHHTGTFWKPNLTYLYPDFRNHPPMALAMQAGFYKLFGDSIWIDKLYSFFMVAVTACIMLLIWRSQVKPENRFFGWLPILLWISFPIMTWCAVNNMLENTMMIFTTLSVFLILKSTKNYRILLLILAGFSVFCGFMSKGFVALFPLSCLFWFWLFTRKISFIRCIIDSAILTTATLLPFVVIYFRIPAGLEYLELYVQKQVLGSIEAAQTVNSRFFILFFLIQQVIPGLLILFGIFIVFRKKKLKLQTEIEDRNIIYVFIATALSGIIPMMISLKQSGFYISSTLPLFAIAFSLFILPYLTLIFENYMKERTKQTGLLFTSVSLLIISIIVSLSFMNKPIRDKELLSDVHKITSIVPKYTSIAGEKVLYANWSLIAYLKRFAGIELQKGIYPKFNYILTEKNPKTEIPDNFKELKADLIAFRLYKKE
jgi:4-amino-4-deoxy-L-arabinose transferase-like glycosyltransferase